MSSKKGWGRAIQTGELTTDRDDAPVWENVDEAGEEIGISFSRRETTRRRRRSLGKLKRWWHNRTP